jgi:peptidoglycan/LPS O-acetylase OafA/YrhL
MKYALLDPLRGLAALWVFLFHLALSQSFQERLPLAYAILKQGGHLGVAMFFVISGYCLTASARTTIARGDSAAAFLYRRARRIYPPFWYSMLAAVAIAFLMSFLSGLKSGVYALPSPQQDVANGFIHFGLLDWFKVATLVQVVSPLAHDVPPVLYTKFQQINLVYWSLAIEFQFYIVVAMALKWRPRFYTSLAAVTVISLPFSLIPWSYTVGIFPPYWMMFAIGIGVYWCFERGIDPERLFGRGAALVGVAAVVSGALLFLAILRSEGAVSQVPFAVLFGFVLLFAKGLDRSFRALLGSSSVIVRGPFVLMTALGAISYSLYLLHPRLWGLVAQIARQVIPRNSMAYDLVVVVVTLLLCYPFYRYCELPFRSYRPRTTPTVQHDLSS